MESTISDNNLIKNKKQKTINDYYNNGIPFEKQTNIKEDLIELIKSNEKSITY